MAYTLGNKCTENCCKRTILAKLVVEDLVKRFFGTLCRMLWLPDGEKNEDNVYSF